MIWLHGSKRWKGVVRMSPQRVPCRWSARPGGSRAITLAVYRYAQDENAQGPFAQHDLANPFVGGGKHSWSIRRWLGRAKRLCRL